MLINLHLLRLSGCVMGLHPIQLQRGRKVVIDLSAQTKVVRTTALFLKKN